MSNDNKNNYTPSLRFPEFKGEWIQKELGKLAEFRRGTTITAKETVNGDVPVIAGGQTPSYFHNVSNREGQTIAISGSGAYAGFVSFWDIPVYLSDSFSVDTKPELNRKYAYYYLKSQQQSLFLMQKGAGVPHVHGSDVGNIIIPLPPTLAEQQKIASCLSEIDNLISAQDQKVDALKEKKKGLMQQMFPQQGETTPKLRFPGFEGEWIEKKLGEVADFQNGYSYNSSTFTDEGDYVIRISDIKDGTISLKSAVRSTTVVSDVFKVVKGDILIAMSGATTGKIGEYRNDNVAYINQRVGNIKPFDINKKLLLFILQSDFFARYLNGILTVGAQPNISSQQICSFGFMLPSSDSEQKQIAECLSELEDLIIFESEKLEALKDHKKGLMQQLFPQPSK